MSDSDAAGTFAARLMGRALRFRPAALILSAVQRDLFERLRGGDEPRTIARPEEDPEALERICRALAGLDLLEVDGATYRPGPGARACLTDAGEHDLRPILRHMHEVYDLWGQLDRVVETGQADFEFPEGGDDETTFTPAFIAAMEARAVFDKEELADALAPRLGSGTLLDLGGGSGVYSRAVLRRAPEARGVLADLPGVVGEAEDYVRRDGLQDRMTVRPLDMLEDADYGSGHDMVLLSSVLHMFGPGDVRTILKRAARALVPGGSLAIRDYLLDDDKTGPADAALFDLMMLLATEAGRTYSLAEYRDMLGEAGFADVERIDLENTADELLIARRT